MIRFLLISQEQVRGVVDCENLEPVTEMAILRPNRLQLQVYHLRWKRDTFT